MSTKMYEDDDEYEDYGESPSRMLEKAIREDIEVTVDLQDEFERQSARFAYWYAQYAKALDEVRRCEEQSQLKFFELYEECKQDTKGKAKENECKAYAWKQKEYMSLKGKERYAKHTRDMLKGVVDALVMKKEMLQQLGPRYRQEMDATRMGAPKEVVDHTIEGLVRDANRMVMSARKRKGKDEESSDE